MSDIATQLLQLFVDKNASDLYLTVGAVPAFRVLNNVEKHGGDSLKEEDIRSIMGSIIDEKAIAEFNETQEYNTAIHWENKARMRVNIFRQRQNTGMVIRRIRTDIPYLESLSLSKIYADLVMEKRGLILVAGTAGAGKSTTLAAMIGHRNLHGSGHIITIEDPIEFMHEHRNCIITQRDVGIDTASFKIGMKNALRQTPDVIVIGEIRDRETMEQAIFLAETGHLVLATMHANNTGQAVDRVINFFPPEQHAQIFMNLSINLRAILAQRLVRNTTGDRCVALEILLNEGLIRHLILEGRSKEIRELVEKGSSFGMQTFEQSLLDLYARNIISEETALLEADSPANMRLAMTQLGINRHRIAPTFKPTTASKNQF